VGSSAAGLLDKIRDCLKRLEVLRPLSCTASSVGTFGHVGRNITIDRILVPAEHRLVMSRLATVPWDRNGLSGITSASAATAEVTTDENGQTGRLPGEEKPTSLGSEKADRWRRVRRSREVGSRD
jgi:hypothetical protein